MTAPEHNPLPWHDDGFGMVDANGNKVRIYGSGTVFSKELVNRRLVIHAVNSHDALLAAAEETIAVFDEFINRNFGGEVDLKPRELAAVMAMKAAIATAKEQAP